LRLTEISVTDVPPIKSFDVGALSNIVVLAGPNGVGKTRLAQAILDHFRNPTGVQNVRLIVHATSPEELREWGKKEIDTGNRGDATKLITSLQQGRRRIKWRSSVINFESDRSIQKVTPLQSQWDFADPWEEKIGWDFTFSAFRARFQDVLHSIFRKVQSQRDHIARRAEELRRRGETSMPLDFKDPLEPFKKAFSQLLSPKELLDADPKRQHLDYSYEGKQFPWASLSSGEQEVANIVFDFILRSPSHSIIMFDEPELHLHPELSFKLLRTLETVGEHNQFIFCTHSPDIITASLEHSVIFIAPPKDPVTNQAIPVSADDETNQALNLLGQSIGIVALGRRIVLIEGANSSLDKQVYGSIIRNKFPNLVLVPSGGRGTITSFATISSQVLEKTIWGVDFFMLCDGDSAPPLPDEASSDIARLRILPRYHLENFFLDEQILAKIFSQMEPPGSLLTSPEAIGERLREIAHQNVSYAVALQVSAIFRKRMGNLVLMPKNCHGLSEDELQHIIMDQTAIEQRRMSVAISEEDIKHLISKRFKSLNDSLQVGKNLWKQVIPGRPILNTFASQAKIDTGRLKMLYLHEAEKDDFIAFREVVEIFAHFSSFTK
jgi:ABC-type cobalamin/Fe3+-siderophores transport system ATPase subunit